MRKQVNCGGILIGGNAPISIQSMTNVDSRDEKALLKQTLQLEEAGCQIVRIAVPDMESIEAFKKVKQQVSVPLVADIHFDYRLAIEAIKAGADKIRINPGNIGSVDRIKAVVNAAQERNVPIRVGVNSGSLEKEIIGKYGGVTAEGLVESGLKSLSIIEDMDYDNLVVSIKSSRVQMNYDAHKLLAKKTQHPIHIGITEAGTIKYGKIKSAAGIGALLLEGIGDTMRVSLTADPVEEVIFAKDLLNSIGIRQKAIDYISCPTCGRTKIDLESLASQIQTKLEPMEESLTCHGTKPLSIAIMGCVVNGPGEAKEADYGVAGGDGKGIIFKKGQLVKSVAEKDIIKELVKVIEENEGNNR